MLESRVFALEDLSLAALNSTWGVSDPTLLQQGKRLTTHKGLVLLDLIIAKGWAYCLDMLFL